jgi:hypothetical protein
VTSLSDSTFYGCTGLTNVTIPNGVTSIGASTFYGCTGLTNVTTPSSVTSIGSSAFRGCIGLTSVTIPNGVTSIVDFTFYGCTGLTSVTIPNGVTGIGASTFYGCTGLTNVTTPSSVTSIGSSAFRGCIGLTSVTIPNGVTILADFTFYGCTGLTSVTIPSSVTSIGSNAFSNCTGLTTIYFRGNAPLADSAFNLTSRTNIYYRLGTTGWKETLGGLYTVPLGPPNVVGPPTSLIANVGDNISFSVTTGTTNPLPQSYQWQRNGIDISGATSSTLYLSGVQAANVGTYTVIISNDIGSTSSSATLTLTQSGVFTQEQYEAALQAGISAGIQSGIAAGRAQVIESPNSYGLYSLSQVRSLHVGTPILTKDQSTGKFKLTIGVSRSNDLMHFSPMPIPAQGAPINARGELEVEFTSPDNAAFFRLESK